MSPLEPGRNSPIPRSALEGVVAANRHPGRVRYPHSPPRFGVKLGHKAQPRNRKTVSKRAVGHDSPIDLSMLSS
jgi:hypothetical protein